MDERRIRDIEQLLLKRLEGELSPPEARRLESWAAESAENRRLLEALSDTDWMMEQLAELDAIPLPVAPARPATPVRRLRPVRRLGWAAAIAGLLAAGWWLASDRQVRVPKPPVAEAPARPDVQPGQNGAVLTLADGTTIPLDSMAQGVIARQGASRLTLANGQLAYDVQGAEGAATEFNTITIPRGRQFRLVLPDGSKVWLNSASSIRFPVAFTGPERPVTVSGEAYFEVAENRDMPFVVKVGDSSTLRVLGTRFNVKAYPEDKGFTATLLEGKLKVQAGKYLTILMPGQHASVLPNGVLGKSWTENPEAAVAWKNGLFSFDDKKLDEVMRELARWYDLEIVYEKGVPDIMFGGEMGRNEPLSNVLLGLQDANVKFRIEANRRLVVLP